MLIVTIVVLSFVLLSSSRVSSSSSISSVISTLDEEVSSFLKDKLAHFKIPVHYWWVNQSLPRGATDKFDRIKIKEMCLNNSWSDEDG